MGRLATPPSVSTDLGMAPPRPIISITRFAPRVDDVSEILDIVVIPCADVDDSREIWDSVTGKLDTADVVSAFTGTMFTEYQSAKFLFPDSTLAVVERFPVEMEK